MFITISPCVTSVPSLVFDHSLLFVSLFFFNATATTDIYTLSLHDALPISRLGDRRHQEVHLDEPGDGFGLRRREAQPRDRKSTRLNSSHLGISYAVFCLKNKTINQPINKVYKDTTRSHIKMRQTALRTHET